MTSETITYNNKKVIKKTNSNGEVSYILRGLYLGIDEKTGKQVTTSITAKTLRQLDRKILTARVNFEKQVERGKKINDYPLFLNLQKNGSIIIKFGLLLIIQSIE